ncbi:hypothetical protein AAFF_G00114720 [Aldrovandia affinis]|uniref:Uncharacterized protein n=1 Tax=Aldrovandia affinis TaxID=143900 RepID=A0AAD7RVH7_9TELE|nr:hypothetical protein AAFF_G00114720 [Aldrovandia affinis]
MFTAEKIKKSWRAPPSESGSPPRCFPRDLEADTRLTSRERQNTRRYRSGAEPRPGETPPQRGYARLGNDTESAGCVTSPGARWAGAGSRRSVEAAVSSAGSAERDLCPSLLPLRCRSVTAPTQAGGNPGDECHRSALSRLLWFNSLPPPPGLSDRGVITACPSLAPRWPPCPSGSLITPWSGLTFTACQPGRTGESPQSDALSLG